MTAKKCLQLCGLLLFFGGFGCAHLDEDRKGPEGHLNVQEHRYGVFFKTMAIREDRISRYSECIAERSSQINRTGMRYEDVQAVCYCETTARNGAELQACGMGLRVAVSGNWGTPAYGSAWSMGTTMNAPSAAATKQVEKDLGAVAKVAKAAAEKAAQNERDIATLAKAAKALAQQRTKGGTP